MGHSAYHTFQQSAVGQMLDLLSPSLVSVPTGLSWLQRLGACRVVPVHPEPGLCSVHGSVQAAVTHPAMAATTLLATHSSQASEDAFQGSPDKRHYSTRREGTRREGTRRSGHRSSQGSSVRWSRRSGPWRSSVGPSVPEG